MSALFAENMEQQDAIDLATLGKTWIHVNDASPEVEDVIDRLPSWASRVLLYVTFACILTLLVWGSLAKIDLVAVGRGALVPQGNIKLVQSASAGTVQHVFVKEGDRAERGAVLVQLDASEMRTRVSKLRQELQTRRSQLQGMMVSRPVTETLEQQNQIARLQGEIAAAEQMLQHTTITAPVAGTIATIAVRGDGEVLQPGQTIATIAPAGVPLVVEAQLPNKDIAFVEKGLPVKLKFDALPFQDYGVVDGTVVSVSPDAVSQQSGSFYKVTIALSRSEIFAGQREVVLRPGLALTAEIVTERRSLLSFLFEPVRRYTKSGLTL
jgi:hemolysin D